MSSRESNEDTFKLLLDFYEKKIIDGTIKMPLHIKEVANSVREIYFFICFVDVEINEYNKPQPVWGNEIRYACYYGRENEFSHRIPKFEFLLRFYERLGIDVLRKALIEANAIVCVYCV